MNTGAKALVYFVGLMGVGYGLMTYTTPTQEDLLNVRYVAEPLCNLPYQPSNSLV